MMLTNPPNPIKLHPPTPSKKSAQTLGSIIKSRSNFGFIMLNLTSFRLLPILLFAFFALSAKAQVSLFEGDTVFVVVDQKPTFPGGFEGVQKFIRKNSRLKVTSAKRSKNLVVVQAFCTKEGKLIINLLEYRGKEASHKESVYKEEARRLIENMPKWTPGKKEGRVVVATTVLSFKFR